MEPSVEDLIAIFASRQLSQVLANGASMGLSPLTVAATMLQVTAASLAGVAPVEAVAIMRAYADCIEAGPIDSPAKQQAQASFHTAAAAFVAAAQVSRDFPAPQGRA